MEPDEKGEVEVISETKKVIQSQVEETVDRIVRSRFPDFDEVDAGRREEMLVEATDGLCKFASFDVLANLAGRNPGVFDQMCVISTEIVDPSSPLNMGKPKPAETHSYYVVHRSNTYFAGSPGNYNAGGDRDYSFKVLSAKSLFELLSEIQKRDRAKFPSMDDVATKLKQPVVSGKEVVLTEVIMTRDMGIAEGQSHILL